MLNLQEAIYKQSPLWVFIQESRDKSRGILDY